MSKSKELPHIGMLQLDHEELCLLSDALAAAIIVFNGVDLPGNEKEEDLLRGHFREYQERMDNFSIRLIEMPIEQYDRLVERIRLLHDAFSKQHKCHKT